MEQVGPELRQETLRARLERGAPLSLGAAAREFGVSTDTIRRDLKALEDRGLARCIRGGAMPVLRPARPAMVRMAQAGAAAERLAAAALALIEDGMAIALDGGTTVLALAQRLPPLPNALIVTPAPGVALATIAAGIPTHLIGGRLSGLGAIAVGHGTVAGFESIAVDLAILGACGMEAAFGLSADDPDEADVKRAMAASSRRTVVLTGQEKLGRRARHRVAACGGLDVLVTDADRQDTEPFAAEGLEIVHA